MVYFAIHETYTLIPSYAYDNQLLLFKYFIDGIIGIYIPSNNQPNAWQEFQDNTNSFGILTWDFNELATSVNFLDFAISIEDNKITTKIDQQY